MTTTEERENTQTTEIVTDKENIVIVTISKEEGTGQDQAKRNTKREDNQDQTLQGNELALKADLYNEYGTVQVATFYQTNSNAINSKSKFSNFSKYIKNQNKHNL